MDTALAEQHQRNQHQAENQVPVNRDRGQGLFQQHERDGADQRAEQGADAADQMTMKISSPERAQLIMSGLMNR